MDAVPSPGVTPVALRHASGAGGHASPTPSRTVTAIAGPSRTTSFDPDSNLAKSGRVPSRRLLQSALDLAQHAVEMDRANDVQGALTMYREAVGRLRSVMERVGMDLGPLPSGLGLAEQSAAEKEEIAQARRRRRLNSGRAEEEGKTLKGIVSSLATVGRERHPSNAVAPCDPAASTTLTSLEYFSWRP
jgi:hypothetical protein